MARAMLKDKGIPLKFWAEAVFLVVYIHNRSPTRAVPNKTPIEAWSGTTPNISHLKIFGSVCYAHVPKENRSKLDDKSERCIFMGYSDGTKGYRLYNLEKKKLVVSRDVIFDEKKVYNWKSNQIPICQQTTIIILQNQDVQTIPNVAAPSQPPQTTPSRDPSSSVAAQPEYNPQPKDNLQPNASNSQSISSSSQHPDVTIEVTPSRVRTLAEIYERTERCNFSVVEPQTFEQAKHTENWREAMEQEIGMIEKNNTWELVDRPTERSVIGVKWIYKTKLNPDGLVQKFKARLVAKGFKQKPRIDYFETYASVARLLKIRTVVALVAQTKWCIFQLDVKPVFLNGELNEEIFC